MSKITLEQAEQMGWDKASAFMPGFRPLRVGQIYAPGNGRAPYVLRDTEEAREACIEMLLAAEQNDRQHKPHVTDAFCLDAALWEAYESGVGSEIESVSNLWDDDGLFDAQTYENAA